MTLSKEAKAWNIILDSSLKLPKVKVEKASWFEKVLTPFVADAVVRNAISASPLESGMEPRTVKKIADLAFRAHRRGVTALSLVTGLPGGLLLAGAVPADLAQYFWHVVKISQKLGLLYGWPDLIEDPKRCDEGTRALLTIFTAYMFGSDKAEEAIKQMHATLERSEEVVVASRLVEEAKLTKEAAALHEWMGLTATRDSLTKTLARIVPVIGGLFSGTLSYIAFTKMAGRLNDLLFALSRPEKQHP